MWHWLADVHSGSFAPAFPLSFHDRKFARKPPMPIASVVRGSSRNKKTTLQFGIKSLTNCPLSSTFRRICKDRICWLSNFCTANNSSQIFMEEKTRNRLVIHVTTITTGKQKETGTLSACRLKRNRNKRLSFWLNSWKCWLFEHFDWKQKDRKTKILTSHYNRFLEFHFATLVLRQLEKKQTNLRLEIFTNSITRI